MDFNPATALLRRPWALVPAAYVLFLLILSLFCLTEVLGDADTGWHIYAGKYIADHKALPAKNMYSFTAEQQPWYNLSWLWDLAAYGTDGWGGLLSVAMMTLVLIALTIAVLTFALLQGGAGVIATTLTLMIGSTAFLPALLARPHHVTLLMLALFSLLLHNKRRWPLPFLMVLWVNCHGGFMAGFTLLAADAAQHALDRDFKNARSVALAMATCFAATFINPLGYGIYEAAQLSMAGQLQQHVVEWQRVNAAHQLIYPLCLVLSFYAGWERRHTGLAVLSLLWLPVALASARHLPVFFILSAPLFAHNLQRLIVRWPLLIKKEQDYQRDFSSRITRLSLLVIGFFLTLALSVPAVQTALNFDPAFKKIEAFPREEVAYLSAHAPGARVLNFYDYGGYIIYLSHGTIKTFIDGRAETAFSPSLIKDYIAFALQQPGWQDVPDKYGIDAVLLPNTVPHLSYFRDPSHKWSEVFTGPKAIIFARQKNP